MILLTDGVNNTGDIEPREAADLAARFGIASTPWAPDTPASPPCRSRCRGDARSSSASASRSTRSRSRIAQRSGGRYFHATDADGIREVLAEIDRLERAR